MNVSGMGPSSIIPSKAGDIFIAYHSLLDNMGSRALQIFAMPVLCEQQGQLLPCNSYTNKHQCAWKKKAYYRMV